MSQRPELRVFDEWRIRKVVSDRLAMQSAERAFRALGQGLATVPRPVGWQFPEVHGEVHIKGARLHDSDLFTFKVATGFYGNVEMGVPTGAGFVLIFDAATGFPRGILADNGYLTDLRTAAAGALAVSLLTPQEPLRVTILGSGVQGQLQLRMLSHVREIQSLKVWSRSPSRAQRWGGKLREAGLPDVEATLNVSAAVAESDLVISATPAQSPLIEAGALGPGSTVIALGSDAVGKQELAPEILVDADKVVTDLTSQCLRLGELQHPVGADLMDVGDVYAELGQIVVGQRSGRESDEIIICDLTGVGAQDAAIGEMAFLELTGQDARWGC